MRLERGEEPASLRRERRVGVAHDLPGLHGDALQRAERSNEALQSLLVEDALRAEPPRPDRDSRSRHRSSDPSDPAEDGGGDGLQRRPDEPCEERSAGVVILAARVHCELIVDPLVAEAVSHRPPVASGVAVSRKLRALQNN